MQQLGRLFGDIARVKLLRLFIFNRDSSFTLPELATRLKIPKETARRELTDLAAAGVLKKRPRKSGTAYQVNPTFAHYEALEAFIRDTTSASPRNILQALRKAGSLQLVALSGLFTGTEDSQVDLLVVGDHLQQGVLARAVRGLEAELGREIRYAFFSTPDFRYRYGVFDRLLRDIFDYPHRLLVDRIGL